MARSRWLAAALMTRTPRCRLAALPAVVSVALPTLLARPLRRRARIDLKQNRGGVVFAAYPKTGVTFSRQVLEHLGPWEDHSFGWCRDAESCSSYSCGFLWDLPFAVNSSQNLLHFVAAPSVRWAAPRGARIIHWYREPESMVISAYRYHKRATNELETWMFLPAVCTFCSPGIHEHLFAGCGYTCSYSELLNSVGVAEGVQLSTLMATLTIRHMTENLKRWAGDPRVLHLSMAHLWTSFNETLRCVFRFLRLRHGSLFRRLQKLDPGRGAGHTGEHLTTGRFRNRPLEGFLDMHHLAHMFDGAVFAHDGLLPLIQRRQLRLYGCPVVP
uniref:Sulfotransferase domain-containing protein n=1 Tax=Alexandrium monilatum TaxID=311494 RepID=A0A6T1I4D0_9DINO